MTRVSLLLLLCVSGTPRPQDEDYQRRTVLLSLYPERDRLARASALAKEGRYAEAMTLYDEAVEKHPRAMVPLDEERAVGLWDWVHAQIAAWPEEGRAVHRRKVDPLAAREFEGAKRAQDVDGLERIVERWPYSSYVDDALALTANLWLDAGDHARAASALARLLASESDVPRPVTMARLGLAWARAGTKDLLVDLAARAAREHPGAKVHAGGREVDLAGHLLALARETPEGRPAAPPLAIPAWEMMGGGISGSRLAEGGVRPAGPAWRAPVSLPRYEQPFDFGRGRMEPMLQTPDFRPLFPAVSDGLLYVHNETSVSAYNFFARREDRLWEFRVPLPDGEVMFDNRVVYATTVHEGRVFANLLTGIDRAEDQLGYVRVKFPFPRRALFALDAYTGRLLWRLGGHVGADQLEDNATFSVPPTPEGNRLYVGAIRQKFNTDPFHHYVLCLEASTGRVLWSTFVASGGTEINLFGNSTRESLGSPVAVTEDAVYYCTHHGAVAALEKRTGRLRWAFRYAQLPISPTRSIYVAKNRLGWVNSPPVAAQGMLAVTPMDSPYLYVLDARTGAFAWRRPRAREIRSIYGARDGTLVLGGERLEFLNLRDGTLRAETAPELLGTGRGVVAEDGVWVAGMDKVRRVAWDGSWDEREARSWPGGREGGGNLIVVDGAIVLAAADGVEVCFDPRDQERAIREELARSPDDPAVLYRGALRWLQSGSREEAARLLARAVERAGASRRAEDERLERAARKRLFAVLMESGRAALEARLHPKAAELFAAAGAASPDAASQVEAAHMLGRARLAGGDTAGAVDAFQKLIVERGEEMRGGVRVFDVAREAVGAVLKAADRGIYQRHEAEAQRLMTEARREGTPDAFARVFRTFPNSLAAEEALHEAAGVFARLGRVDEEIDALRRFLREFPDSPLGPEANAGLVRALEKKGHVASAGAILRRMMRQTPEARVDDGGRRVTVREFAESRLRAEPYSRPVGAPPASKLTPPLRKAFEFTDPGHPEGVPLRIEGAPPSETADLVFMNYGGVVKALDARKGEEAWRHKHSSTVRYAVFVEDGLILAGDWTVERLDLKGNFQWRHQARSPMRGFALSRAYLCFLSPDPRGDGSMMVTALDTSRNAVAWSQNFEGTPPSMARIHAAGEGICFLTVEPCRIQFFEIETGRRLLAEASFTQDNTAQIAHAAEGLVVVRSEGRFVEAVDLSTGKLRWRLGLKYESTRAMEVGPGGLAILGSIGRPPREKFFLAVVDLQSGKILQMKEDLAAGDPRYLLLDGEMAYVLSLEEDRSASARAFRLSDFSTAWTAPLGDAKAVLLPPSLTKDHVVVARFESKDDKYAYGAHLLDKGGKVVQNIRSEFVFERPPGCAVANGRLIFSVDSKVDVYR